MADNMEQYRALLDKVRVIHAENAKIQEYRKARGEMFNTFSVLHHWGEEVTVHSRFIAELLNPNGSHGCGAQLLEAFCDTVGITDFNCEEAKVEVEKYIGQISKDGTEGGRLDIFIEQADKKRCIVIENKIYADDESNQLLRYRNFCDSKYKDNWIILYLSPWPRVPDECSTGKVAEDKRFWKNITYRDDIAAWLAKCARIACNKERVRVGVNEYLDLIKRITGDGMGSEMREELVDLMTKDNNLLLVAGDLAPLILDAKLKLLDGIKTALKDRFALTDENFWFDYNHNKDAFNTYDGFSLHDEKYANIGMDIAFEFQSMNLRDLVCGVGVSSDNHNLTKVLKKLKDNCKNGEWQSEGWGIVNYLSKYRDWDSKTLLEIRDNMDAFLSFIDEQRKYYSDILDLAIAQAK